MSRLYAKFLDNCKNIEKYYENLVELTKNHNYVGSTNEWIIDNYYLVAEKKSTMEKLVKRKTHLKEQLENNQEMYDILVGIFEKHHYNVGRALLFRELNFYQTRHDSYFSYSTIEFIPIFLSMIFIEELNKLCIRRESKQEDLWKVKDLMDEIEKEKNDDPSFELEKYVKIDDYLLTHPVYLYHLNANLKEFGEDSSNFFRKLNSFLEEHHVNLKEVIHEEHLSSIEDNMLVSNLFNHLREFSKVSFDELCDKISKTEKLLLTDSVYKNMTQESKNTYRLEIIRRTKKKDEYQYVNSIVEESLRKGVGIHEFLVRKRNTRRTFAIYFTLFLFFTLILSCLVSLVLFPSVFGFWLGFFLLLIPVSEVVLQVLNKVFMKFYRPVPFPKLDFSKGIPRDCATVVVIPTIIKDTKKIDSVFQMLEKYYLSNQSPNLYFTLLGDCSESDVLSSEVDEEIGKHGLSSCERLNQKYGKNLFYFVYRKRVYSSVEEKYLGYERKRGALIHFNQILLNRFSKEDFDKYIWVENVSSLKNKIKYVITLDVDTELLLDSAKMLVGTMAHPCHKPVLNEARDKVIRGYGMMQPRVSIDIESTNKSIYSQLMAGVGGFDTYSSVIPNFYQDVFLEGSFVGKGIYDLEVFDTVLSKRFPENLILSHDLLEGNYLRCGYVSDLELIDDFPSNFLTDMSRQHRWARGDVQILGWLFGKVKDGSGKKVRNPLNALEKFKIFDNIRRLFLPVSLFFLILSSFFLGNSALTTLVVMIIISFPIVFYVREIFNIEKRTLASFKHYDSLIYGVRALFSRIYLQFITIPYHCYMNLEAFFQSIYRMFVSHKRLLNWVTAEEASKRIGRDLSTYLSSFFPNYVALVFLLLLSIWNIHHLPVGILLSLCFLSAPFVLFLVSKEEEETSSLKVEENEDLLEIGHKTWLYFSNLLTAENHYLIPDNYQLNREMKEDFKTSPTDIGMSMVSVVSSYELGYISRDVALHLLKNIFDSLSKLEKWNGLIYSWYNIKTLEKMYPYDISSVDNGNLAASLMVAHEFVHDLGEEEFAHSIEMLFEQMDFSKLYSDSDVFSVTYHTTEEKLSIYNYNKFASESRILSFVAIAKGDVPSKHWLCLDKSLTKFGKYKGLTSWSGTSFEYYMPLIFMKSYPNTLLDESYFFALYCQKEYMKEINPLLPWGISEAAYGELDDGVNYKYKAFSTPYLRLQEDQKQEVVIAPYASILALSVNPSEVYQNILKLKDLHLYSKWGFFESYDYDDQEIIFSYFAHHQGMILASIANYLKKDCIRNYFHQDIRVQSYEFLLKEKIQFNPVIDLKIYGYKKYNYEKEVVENDIREFNYLSDIPEVSVLSNNDYLLLMNDRGNGFSRYKKIQLNRYRKITEQDYGMFVYLKDKNTGKIWSNTYAPLNTEPDKYNVVFASDRIQFLRQDGPLTTKTEIIVTKEHNAEIRKITLKNHSSSEKEIELTTYTEPIIIENIEDITHRAFKNLFVESSFDVDRQSLVMCRKNNAKHTASYLAHRLIVQSGTREVEYETERVKFLGRNHDTKNPVALFREHLSNRAGTSLDPVISLRTTVHILPGEEEVVYFISGYGKSREQIDDILDAYDDEEKIGNAFKYATLANNMNTKQLGITGPDMRNYNVMLNYLYQTSKHFINPERRDLLSRNSMNQSNLWKYGITGDYPIILVEVDASESMNLVKEVLKAYEFYKSRAIFVDVVVINREKDVYKAVIKREIEKEKYRMYTLYDFMSTPGEIFVLDSNDVNEQEEILLNMVARLRFDTRKSVSLKESIETLQKENKMISYSPRQEEERALSSYDTKDLLFFNGYGGFRHDGKEYVITRSDTPLAWCNVLANPSFGSIVTNNECGFTYAYNSQMFKITSWTNDPVLCDQSEGIKVDDKVASATVAIHGFGYSTFEHEAKDYEFTTTQFVAREDPIKFYKVQFKNKDHKKRVYKITFWLNPTFGPNEEKSSRYLLSEYHENLNSVLIRNVYQMDFSHVTAFMSSTVPIHSYMIDRILFKSIDIELELEENETKEFSFLLGTEIGLDRVSSLVDKYHLEERVKEELENVTSFWQRELGVIKVKTKDESFNMMMNGWYLYQTIASRIYAKAGFYQVGGAFGYRDQLQDAMNLVMTHEELTKRQIIENARHQFLEGDVLHWWHEITHFGLRSRYQDDYLWLVYAVVRYVKASGDVKFLDLPVEFVEGEALLPSQQEKGIHYRYTEEKKSILEHCLLSIHRSISNLAENGLPLMWGGDWNDGMNLVGIKGRGSSVWLGFFLYMVMRDFISLAKQHQKLESEPYEKILGQLKESLNSAGWDEDYYLRAFFDNGDPLGSHMNTECKIDLISQSFSILSEVAGEDKIEKVVRSVEKYLVDNRLGIIKLLTPAFEHPLNNPGYIMDYPPGIRENGGQYTHAVSWYIMALEKIGKKDLAYRYYQMMNPIERSLTKTDVERYQVEPFVIAADIYSNPLHKGRGGWTWYTGSAGWFYYVGLVSILGLQKEGNRLKICPNVPEDWEGFEAEYRYFDTLYKIRVHFGENHDLVVDGDKSDKDYVLLKNDKRIHAVVVNIRRAND